MKLPREKIATVIAFAKVVIAGYGVFASVHNLIDSVREVKTGRKRSVLYVDAGDIPPERMDDYLAETKRNSECGGVADCDAADTTRWGYATRRRGSNLLVKSGYATRSRKRR